MFGNGELKVQGYTDLDFISDIDDRKSILKSIFLYNSGVANWKSSKQTVIADSIMEAEYIAALEAVKEIFWFKKFIAELGVMPSDAVPLYYDNNGTIVLTKELRSHQKFKYIKRWFHLIRDYLEKGYIEMKRVNTTDNVADPLTKSLS